MLPGRRRQRAGDAGYPRGDPGLQAVLVAKIGDGPTEKLRAIGVAAVSDYAWELIDEALLAYARKCVR